MAIGAALVETKTRFQRRRNMIGKRGRHYVHMHGCGGRDVPCEKGQPSTAPAVVA